MVVLDYGSGNVHSAAKAVEASGARVELTADRDRVMAADGLLVPGVGAFNAVMDALRTVRGDELIDRRLAGGRPVLGICVGQQVMFERGDERGVVTDGLGQWPGTVSALQAPTVPHMGWNTVSAGAGSSLFKGIEKESFYFVHSYAVKKQVGAITTMAHHGEDFLAAVEDGVIAATQFHPEKSGDAGLHLIKNWTDSL